MTFDAQIQADFGTALADLRDKVSGMANWTTKDDTSGGAASLAAGDHVVLTSSTPQEDVKFEVTTDVRGLRIEHGPNWDAANDTWSDRYEYDPAAVTDYYDADATGDYATSFTVYGKSSVDPDFPMAMADGGSYWLEYVDGAGFCFYWQREVGDGDDGDLWFGSAKVNRAWDYTTAETREAAWVLGFGDAIHGQRLMHMSASGRTNPDSGEKTYIGGTSNYRGHGAVNPDNDFDNYPLTNNIVSSSQYRTVDGVDVPLGDFDMWLADDSGSATGHKDLIQAADGSDVYTILKRNGQPSVAIRMD